MKFNRILAWLRSRQRAVATGIALASFCVALLASGVSLFQAGLLYSQRLTPYRTALYVRQLQLASDFAGAAHEQWLRIINLYNDCGDRLRGEVPDGDYKDLARDFRSGSEGLHKAYAGTLVTFTDEVHASASRIWSINEDLFDHTVSPAADCATFVQLWGQTGANDKVDAMNNETHALVDQMRQELGVGQLSWPDPNEEAHHRASSTKSQ
jgi:hypothetical protein